ncbi:HNH endonuclease [Nonomuraea sp. NPDC050783]|uniref:HNH endonuclease n=1 Tax=Nonomuraea sp. NPDC050783 TaxID=3154634 RepID=UPI0034661F91
MSLVLYGSSLVNLLSYLPGDQPVDLATLDELIVGKTWSGIRIVPKAWLTWPHEANNGYLHIPLYERRDALKTFWGMSNYIRHEAILWAREILAFGSSVAYVAIKASQCCGRVVDVAVTTGNDQTLLDEQLHCPCRTVIGLSFADIAEKLFELVIWDSKRQNRPLRIGWGMHTALALSTEIQLLEEHQNRLFRRWGRIAKGIELEDAQTWDLYWRCDGEGGGRQRFVIATPTALNECLAVMNRVKQIADSSLTEKLNFTSPMDPFMLDPNAPIHLPVRLGREHFQRRSERAQYRHLCKDAESLEKQGFIDPSKRPRSAAAKSAVLLRCQGKCENVDCENPGAPSEPAIGGGPILEVDHIDDHAKGGRDHPETMIALCPNCHAVKTRGRNRGALREKLRIIAHQRHLMWLSDQ